MTDDHDPRDAARAERVVDDALLALEVTIAELRRSVEEIVAGTEDDEREVVRDLKAFNSAFKLAQTSEANARELLKRNLSAIERGELDLTAARDEIGQRLARLRRADAERGLSNRAE